MKREKTVSKTFKQYHGDWPPEDAAGALAWFQTKLGDVPAEFRGSARIEIDSKENYDSSNATIEFSYVCPETDEELAEREGRTAADEERRRAADLRTLAELQAKYGKPGA